MLQVIRHGIRISWSSRKRPRNSKGRLVGQEHLEPYLQDYLSRGVIIPANPKHFCLCFPVAKKSGKLRLTTDFTPINTLSKPPPHFSLISGDKVGCKYIQRGDWMCTVDLSDAYNHLCISKHDAKFAGLQWNGKSYIWQGMGFGLKSAPWEFTTVLRAALKPLRGVIRLVDYLDDLLILGRSPQECAAHTATLISWLEILGFTINREKSSLSPSQEVEYLGWRWSSKDGTQHLPVDKQQRISVEIRKMLNRTRWSLRETQRLQGLINWLLGALPEFEKREFNFDPFNIWYNSTPTFAYHRYAATSFQVQKRGARRGGG